jgi:hypothetical protein
MRKLWCSLMHRAHWVRVAYEYARRMSANGTRYTVTLKRWECARCGERWWRESKMQEACCPHTQMRISVSRSCSR